MNKSKTRWKNSIFILLTLYLFNCNNKTGEELNEDGTEWEGVKIDPGIRKNSIYADLNKQEEVFSAFEEMDSFTTKTSGVAYYSGVQRDPKSDYYARFNNCRSFFFKHDTLSINIGISSGLGGWGFGIDYHNKRFHTQPYYFDDVIYEGEIEPIHKIIYQKLTLDKPDYKPGDSLYGWVEFKSIEKSGFNRGREHTGTGYFRTKVGKIKFDK
jgi:hypothetical protein